MWVGGRLAMPEKDDDQHEEADEQPDGDLSRDDGHGGFFVPPRWGRKYVPIARPGSGKGWRRKR